MLSRSGVGTLLARLVPALEEAGVHRQHVLADLLADSESELSLPPGIRVDRAWSPGGSWWRVGDRLAAADCDIIHIQHEVFLYGGPRSSHAVPRMVSRARARGAPIVMTVHGVPDLRSVDRTFVRANGSKLPTPVVRAALRRLIGAAARCVDRVLVHEERFAGRLSSQYGVSAEKVAVIPHPAPEVVRIDRAVVKSALGLDRQTALFFGFVSGYKGLPILFDAWQQYRAAGGQAELVVAGGRHPRMSGEPSYEAEYRRLLEWSRGLGGVRWEGYLDEQRAAEYLTACDVMVLPYRIGMAASGPLSHALAYGLPVVCSSALAEAAPDARGVFGDTPEALSDTLAAVLDGTLGADLRSSSAAKGAECALPRIAEQLVCCYQEVAGGR